MSDTAIERDLDAIRWYVNNLNDVIARKPVRGLDEAEAGYVTAISHLRSALAKADAEVTALADALRAAGVAPTMVQAMIDAATPRGQAAA